MPVPSPVTAVPAASPAAALAHFEARLTYETDCSDTVFVVYCAGPHCNGANKGAVALAKLGRPVKEMIGGVVGWLEEGYMLTSAPVSFRA